MLCLLDALSEASVIILWCLRVSVSLFSLGALTGLDHAEGSLEQQYSRRDSERETSSIIVYKRHWDANVALIDYAQIDAKPQPCADVVELLFSVAAFGHDSLLSGGR